LGDFLAPKYTIWEKNKAKNHGSKFPIPLEMDLNVRRYSQYTFLKSVTP